ncbi:MAG: hypothetical protein ACWGSD_11435, partial [Thermodesulfobacteriota bacterium]
LDSLSDLFGLRLPLPQVRPAQISEGIQDTSEARKLSGKHGDISRALHWWAKTKIEGKENGHGDY